MHTKQAAPRQRLNATAQVTSKVATCHAGQPQSVLDELYQQGSARIRFPNTGTPTLQAVLLNTAGGLTGDDVIQWRARAGTGSHLCISTAANEKIYRTHGPVAIQKTNLAIESGARADWLPQETIVFDQAALRRTLNVQVHKNAEALVAECLVFGRQAMPESLHAVQVHDSWRLFRDNKLLHAEEFKLNTSAPTQLDFAAFAQQPGIAHQYSAMATIVLVTHKNIESLKLYAALTRDLANQYSTGTMAAVSVLPHRLIVRALALNSFEMRKFLIPCVESLCDGAPIPTVWNV